MVGDLGLETTPIGFGDAMAEDRAELVGTTDAAIEVQQAFSYSIQSAALLENEVGAVLDLATEQAIDTVGDPIGVGAGIEGHQLAEPALDGHLEIRRGEAVGKLL